MRGRSSVGPQAHRNYQNDLHPTYQTFTTDKERRTLRDLPPEIWLNIVRLLPQWALPSMARTCWRLYYMSIPCIYRSVVIGRPFGKMLAARDLDAQKAMACCEAIKSKRFVASAVKSIILYGWKKSSGTVAIYARRTADNLRRLADGLPAILTSCPNLDTLEFWEFPISPTTQFTIYGIPTLRRLCVGSGSFQASVYANDLAALPITDLHIYTSWHSVQQPTLISEMPLALAHNLCSLTIDSELLGLLVDLFEIRKIQFMIPSVTLHATSPIPSSVVQNICHFLLLPNNTVRELSVQQKFDLELVLPPLPHSACPCLQKLRGSWHLINWLAPSRPVDEVEIHSWTFGEGDYDLFQSVVEALSRSRMPCESLEFSIHCWEPATDTMMNLVANRLPSLKRLTISVLLGGITNALLDRMAKCLERFSSLGELTIRTREESYPGFMMRHLRLSIVQWGKACPALRSIALGRKMLWKRNSSMSDVWRIDCGLSVR